MFTCSGNNGLVWLNTFNVLKPHKGWTEGTILPWKGCTSFIHPHLIPILFLSQIVHAWYECPYSGAALWKQAATFSFRILSKSACVGAQNWLQRTIYNSSGIAFTFHLPHQPLLPLIATAERWMHWTVATDMKCHRRPRFLYPRYSNPLEGAASICDGLSWNVTVTQEKMMQSLHDIYLIYII